MVIAAFLITAWEGVGAALFNIDQYLEDVLGIDRIDGPGAD